MRDTSASGARHIRPLQVNRDAARVDMGRAYIWIMMVISNIIYIMKGVFVLCYKPVGLGGKFRYFSFTTGGPYTANVDCVPLSHPWFRPYIQST